MFCSGCSDKKVKFFLNNRCINRQYHTFFNWKESNVNNFLGLFGHEFKDKVSHEISMDENLKKCTISFLTIGNERNKMVHENFLAYRMMMTFDEIARLNDEALTFIDFIKQELCADEK